MPLWPVLLGLGVVVYGMSARTRRRPVITLDDALFALWKRPQPSAKAMESARRHYVHAPDVCLASEKCCVAYWRRDHGEEGVYETVDIGVFGRAGNLVLGFKDGSIHSWISDRSKRETFDIEETLVSGEVLRRVRYAIERAGF